jgi:hypothetical protein
VGRPVGGIWCLTPLLKRRKTGAAMKLNKWVLWLLLVTFLASEIFLFSALRQKNAAQASFQAARQRADDLQSQLDQLQSARADSQNAEISRLRAENLDLPRLRNEVKQLQAAEQKLTLQLKNMRAFAVQEQTQLQQVATENQQDQVALELADVEAERNACINNLRQIDAAKQQWALDKNKNAAAVPTITDLASYFKDGVLPTCPSGGTYTLNAVGELPTCSISGHTLSQ